MEEESWDQGVRARMQKRDEEVFNGACKAISEASARPPDVEYPKIWESVCPSWFKDLEFRKTAYARNLNLGKEYLKELKALDGKLEPARERAAKLRAEAEKADREANEIEGKLRSLPVFILETAKEITRSRNAVLMWKTGVERALEAIPRT